MGGVFIGDDLMRIGLVVAPRFETFDVYRHLRSIEPRIDHAFVMRSQHRDAFAYFAYEGVGAVSSNSPVLSEHPNAAALWARYSNCHHAVGPWVFASAGHSPRTMIFVYRHNTSGIVRFPEQSRRVAFP